MQATKYSDLFEERRKMPFFQKINLWSIDGGVAIGVDFQMSVGFELFNHPDVGLKTDEEIEGYLHGIRRVVQGRRLTFAVKEGVETLPAISYAVT